MTLVTILLTHYALYRLGQHVALYDSPLWYRALLFTFTSIGGLLLAVAVAIFQEG